jgi:hypothetical protein
LPPYLVILQNLSAFSFYQAQSFSAIGNFKWNRLLPLENGPDPDPTYRMFYLKENFDFYLPKSVEIST